MVASLKDLLTNFSNVCRNDHKTATREANHNVAIAIPITKRTNKRDDWELDFTNSSAT